MMQKDIYNSNKISLVILTISILIFIGFSPFFQSIYIAYLLPDDEFNKRIFSYINNELKNHIENGEGTDLKFEDIYNFIIMPVTKIHLDKYHVVYEVFRKGEVKILKRVDTGLQPICNEYEISSKVNHPNLLNILSMHKTIEKNNDKFTEILWIYSEKLDVEIFKATDDKYNKKKIRKIIKDVSLGLKYLHDRKIAHLDVKMANIMGKTNGDDVVYKLIDFGFSKDLNECPNFEWKTQTMAFGTFPFKPHEVWYECIHSLSTDIYCLGMTAWCLLLNEIPFQYGSRTYNILSYDDFLQYNILFFPSNVSENFKDFIVKCVEKDRSMRLDIDQVLQHPFLCEESD